MTVAETTLALTTAADIHSAAERLRGITVRTPLIELSSSLLPQGSTLHLKAESLQPIGSFKLRGAYNKIAQLSPDELSRGVITYSSGNHAQGVAWAARKLGSHAVIVMPANAPAVKKAATLALGAQVVEVGPASSERLARAQELIAQHGYIMIPPYDDPAIIIGQATCGLEIVEDMPSVDLVLSPVSGGGLLSGTAAAVKLLRPDVKVIGVEPELAGDAAESFHSGRLVEWPAEKTTRTLADGLRTQMLGHLNYAHVRAFVDDIVTITEEQLLSSMRAIFPATRLVPEPSGAAAAAAALFCADKLPPFRHAVALLSGGNADPALLASLLTR